jgi:iron complex outermembrane receptor protein
MKSLANLCAGACVALLPVAAAADLGPIVITPSRSLQPQKNSSATVYVLSAEEIEKNGARTTSELLRGMPGIQIDDLFGNGSEASVGVRGFSTSANANTLVLVNGRRLNNADTSSPDLQHVFPQDIERIEVLVGSAGALYGDQAVGGVINIITKRPAESRHQVNVSAGSYDYRGVQFNSTMQIGEYFGYRLSAETFETDNYRDNNEQENSNLNAVLDYRRDGNHFFVELQAIDDEQELPGALLEDEFEDDPQQSSAGFEDDFRDEETRVYRVGYEREIGMQLFSIDATNRSTDSDIRQSFRGFPSPDNGFVDRDNRSVNPKLSGSFDFGFPTTYVAGIDLEEADFELEIPNAFGTAASSSEQDTDSVYFQVSPRVSQSVQLTLGMRHSSVENDLDYADILSTRTEMTVDDDVTVGELGMIYFIDDATRVTLRYDQNFRFAKIDEFSLTEAGTELDTQTGESWELGLDLARGGHRVIVSIYQLDLEDEIAFDPSVGPDPFGFGPTGLNVNLDKTRRRGATLSWLAQMSRDFSLNADIGVVDARFESGTFEGKEISGVADKIASIRGDYQVSDPVRLYLEYNYSSPKYAQGDNANQFGKLGSITVYNAGIGYLYRGWIVDFRVNNLFDEQYAEFVTNNGFGAAYQPSPERNYFMTAGYRFE